jgi:hypothetical protein
MIPNRRLTRRSLRLSLRAGCCDSRSKCNSWNPKPGMDHVILPAQSAVPMEASQFGGDAVPHPDTLNQCSLLAPNGPAGRGRLCPLIEKQTKADMLLLVNLTRSESRRGFAAPPLALPSSGLAPRTKRADPNRPAFSNPKTSVEAAANDYQSSSEKVVRANPQGGKNVERS